MTRHDIESMTFADLAEYLDIDVHELAEKHDRCAALERALDQFEDEQNETTKTI